MSAAQHKKAGVVTLLLVAGTAIAAALASRFSDRVDKIVGRRIAHRADGDSSSFARWRKRVQETRKARDKTIDEFFEGFTVSVPQEGDARGAWLPDPEEFEAMKQRNRAKWWSTRLRKLRALLS